MRSAISFLAVLVVVSSLIAGCGCLAANSYDKPACQKYDTHWPPPDYSFDYGHWERHGMGSSLSPGGFRAMTIRMTAKNCECYIRARGGDSCYGVTTER